MFLLANGSSASAATDKPLPDIPTLLHEVEAHQDELDRVRENYTFHEVQTLTMLDKKGKVHSQENKENEVFYVHGHQIEKLIGKNGKPLNPVDAKKEEDRATREAEKYAKSGPSTPDKDDVSVSRLLEIINFSNPRRTEKDGRSAIAVDFTGDPHAKTHGRGEDVIKRVHGTVWIDEAAREVVQMDATFDSNLHLGFGMLATLEKGSALSFHQALFRNEVWLPTAINGHFDGKALMFVGFHVTLAIRYDDYRKFGAEATQLPGAKPASTPR